MSQKKLNTGRWKRKILRVARERLRFSPTSTLRDCVRAIQERHPETLSMTRYAALCWFVDEPIHPPAGGPSPEFIASPEFLQTYEWRRLRMEVLRERGARCECCGASPADGVAIHVDHIKPRIRYPYLALEKVNLQVLCEGCNHGKGNWDETDWRPEARNALEVERTFTITADWLAAHSNAAAYTAAQLRVLGISWPPRKGWKRVVVGRRLTEAERRAFENGGAKVSRNMTAVVRMNGEDACRIANEWLKH